MLDLLIHPFLQIRLRKIQFAVNLDRRYLARGGQLVKFADRCFISEPLKKCESLVLCQALFRVISLGGYVPS